MTYKEHVWTNPDGSTVTIRIHENLDMGSIDSTVTFGDGVEIREGVMIYWNAVIGVGAGIGEDARIGVDAEIGDNVWIGANAKIGVDAVIGANAMIGANVDIGWNARIGVNARIGDGATIRSSVTIGDGVIYDVVEEKSYRQEELLIAVQDTVELLKRLSEYYETPQECVKWFRSPQPLINNEIPIDIIAQGRISELHKVWDRLDTGTYI